MQIRRVINTITGIFYFFEGSIPGGRTYYRQAPLPAPLLKGGNGGICRLFSTYRLRFDLLYLFDWIPRVWGFDAL